MTTKISTIFKLSVHNLGHKSFETDFNCTFTYLFGHIVTKEQELGGVSFTCSRITAESFHIVHIDKTEDDQGILWVLFDICY